MARLRRPVADAKPERSDQAWLLHVTIDGETSRERLLRVAGADAHALRVRDRMAVLAARVELGWDVNQTHA